MFSDVKFVFSEEQKEIPAHKNILAAQSEHFKAMLTSGFKENEQSVIEVKDWH